MSGQQNLHGSMRHGSSKASSNRYPQQVASVNASSGTSIGVSQRQRALSGGGSDRVDVASHDIIGASASLPQYTLIPPQDKFLYRSRSGDHTYDEYADVYLQSADQIEDQLTPNTIASGFCEKPILKDEHLSAFNLIYEKVLEKKPLEHLTEMAQEILSIKSRVAIPKYRNDAFMPPTRVFIPDRARDAWMNDLAGNVSLSVLANSVPNILVDVKLLELIVQRAVPIPRAIWFLKVMGLNELVKSRQSNTNMYAPSLQDKHNRLTIRYVTEFINKELLDTTQANITNQTYNVKNQLRAGGSRNNQSTKDGSNTPNPIRELSVETRRQFISRWQYLINLCVAQYHHGLLYQRTFLKFCLDLFQSCNFVQNFFMAPFISAFLKEFALSRTLMRYLLSSCIEKLEKLKEQLSKGTLVQEQFNIVARLLENAFELAPDTLICAKLATRMNELAPEVFIANPGGYKEVERRNKWLMSNSVSQPEASKLEEELTTFTPSTNFKLFLDRISEILDEMDGVHDVVRSLCSWGLRCNSAASDFRRFLVPRILSEWILLMGGSVSEVQKAIRLELCQFLDTTILNCDAVQRHVFVLFKELERLGLFSIRFYLQRQIAREQFEPNAINFEKYQCFIFKYPMPKDDGQLTNMIERFVAGYKHEKTQQSSLLVAAKAKIMEKIPKMFRKIDNDNKTVDVPPVDKSATISLAIYDPKIGESILRLSPLWQEKLSNWLKESVLDYVVQSQETSVLNWKKTLHPGSSLLNNRQFCFIVSVLECMKDYESILEIALWLIDKTTDRGIYRSIVFTLWRNHRQFSAMGCDQLIFDVLFHKHNLLRKREKLFDFNILLFLSSSMAANLGEVQPEQKLVIESDMKISPKKGVSKDLPTEFRELRDINDDSQPATIATTLLWKYHGNPDALKRIFRYALHTVQRPRTGAKVQGYQIRTKIIAEVLREIADRNSMFSDIIVQHLKSVYIHSKRLPSPESSEHELLTLANQNQPNLMLSLLLDLIVNRACLCSQFFADFLTPLLLKFQSSKEMIISSAFSNLIINMISILVLIIVPNAYKRSNMPFIMTYQRIQYLGTIRETDLSGKNNLTNLLHIIQSIVSIRVVLTSVRNTSVSSTELVASIDWLVSNLVGRSEWFKINIISSGAWKCIKLPQVYSEAKSSVMAEHAKDITVSTADLLMKLLWDESLDGSSFVISAPFAYDDFKAGFEHILGRVSYENKGRAENLLVVVLELVNIYQIVHQQAIRNEQAERFSNFLDTLANMLLTHVLKGSIINISIIIPKARWEFLKRLINRSRQHIQEVHSRLSNEEPQFLTEQQTERESDVLLSNSKTTDLFGDFVLHLVISLRTRFYEAQRSSNAKQIQQVMKNEAVSFVKFLYGLVCWFFDSSKCLDSMVDQSLSYGVALGLARGQTLLKKPPHIAASIPPTFENIQGMLKMILNVAKGLVPFIIEHPVECEMEKLLKTLLRLLSRKICLHNPVAGSVFEVAYDCTTWLMDENAKEQNPTLFKWLSDCRSDFNVQTPMKAQIDRILPFEDHNWYLNDLMIVSDASTGNSGSRPQTPSNAQSSGGTMSNVGTPTKTALEAKQGIPYISPAYTRFFMPLSWVDNVNEVKPAVYSWSTEVGLDGVMNDGPISLSHFDACVLAPSERAYIELSKTGWSVRNAGAADSISDSEVGSGLKRKSSPDIPFDEIRKRQRI